MIDLYTWGTPNGHKIHIMLEETGVPFRLHKVNIGAREQFSPEYVKINPNSKIPAIVDQGRSRRRAGDDLRIRRHPVLSGEKTGRFLPRRMSRALACWNG